MPEYDEVPSGQEEGDGQTPPQVIPDNDVIPFDDEEVAERILENYKVLYSEIFLFEDTEQMLLFNRGARTSHYLSVL